MRQLTRLLLGVLRLAAPFFVNGQKAPSRIAKIVGFDNPDFDVSVGSLANYLRCMVSATMMETLSIGTTYAIEGTRTRHTSYTNK